MARVFGRLNVWQIAESKLVGIKKFGEWIDSATKVIIISEIWMVSLVNHAKFA